MSNISYYKNAFDKEGFKQPITLKSFLTGIKEGKHSELAESIRRIVKEGAPAPEVRREKTKLPSAAISGVFSYCENDKLIKHSGFIAIDIDGKENPDVVQNIPWWKNNLAADDYTYAVFQSITGTGLCVIVKIDPAYHRESFRGLQQYYLENYDIRVDTQCINEARVRFTSYDPDLIINEDSETCDMIIEEEPKPEKVNTVESDKLEPLLKYIENNQIDITASYNDWYYVGMSLATVYGEAGRDYYHRVSKFHQNYNYQATDKKFDNFLATSMGRLTLGTLCYTLKKYDVPWRDLVPMPEKNNNQEVNFLKVAYDAKGGIKTDSNGNKIFGIKRGEFINFLHEYGFCKFYPNEAFYFIRVENNIVKKVSSSQIQDFVVSYIKTLPNIVYTQTGGDESKYAEVITNEELNEKLLSGINIYFGEKFLTSLPTIELKSMPVSEKSDYFNFKNGVVKVEIGGPKLIDYKDIDWHVWDTQIINRNIRLDSDPDFEKCQWARFLKLLSDVTYDDSIPEDERSEMTQQRLHSLMTITGYLLHSYKNPANAKAVVLLDQNDTDNPEGGTGKGLFAKGIAQIKNAVIVDGKNFTFDKNFVWQRLDVDTQIVVMDDVNKHFPFERMFSLITEGWPIEKKNKGEIYLSPEESPKIMILNNYVLDGEGASFERRIIPFELGRFFSVDNTPEMHFGNILFYEWDEEEWNLFDHFMIFCLEYYLNKGIIKTKELTVKQRKLEQSMPMEVLEYLEYFCEQKAVKDKFYPTKDMMEEMRLKYDNTKNISSTKFAHSVANFNRYKVGKGWLEKDRVDGIRGYYFRREN